MKLIIVLLSLLLVTPTYANSTRPITQPTPNPVYLATSTPTPTPTPSATPTPTPISRYFSATSPWNTGIPANHPISPESRQIIDFSLKPGTNSRIYISITDYSVPVYYASPSDSLYKVPVKYPWPPYNVPAAGWDLVRIPKNAKPAAGTDGHMVVIEDQMAYDFYQAKCTSGTWTTTYGMKWDLTGSGVQQPWSAACRAAGTPLLAGLITYKELMNGKINHVLAMSVPILRSNLLTPPASAAQQGSTDPRAIVIGSHIQLNPKLNLSLYNLSTAGKVIAQALQTYGAIVVDGSKTVVIYAESTGNWSGVLTNKSIETILLDDLNLLTPN